MYHDFYSVFENIFIFIIFLHLKEIGMKREDCGVPYFPGCLVVEQIQT